jgi:hypothetical protein
MTRISHLDSERTNERSKKKGFRQKGYLLIRLKPCDLQRANGSAARKHTKKRLAKRNAEKLKVSFQCKELKGGFLKRVVTTELGEVEFVFGVASLPFLKLRKIFTVK